MNAQAIESQEIRFSTRAAHWSAVFSLFVGVTGLIAAEFIPVSLLTPIAQDMGISEGMAGQSVTAVGIFAVITSILLAPLTRKIDRRHVLLFFSVLMVASNVIVALAPTYPIMLIGRGMLGICVGGFWSMASAVTLQLVPTKDVPRALSIVYAGVSVATIISLPLASYLGHLVGWRNIFFMGAGIGLVALVWQFLTLPSMPARDGNNFRNMFGLLKRGWVLAGIGATIFSYGGYHVFFTYLRPFLQLDLQLAPGALSAVLLAFGVANCAGTFIAGAILGKHFRATLLGIHLALSALAVLLFATNGEVGVNTGLAIAWGFIFGFIPVAWSTWITRTLADKAEIAGGVSVAAIQFSIGLAAGIGGITFDSMGIGGIFVAAAVIQVLAAVLIKASFMAFARENGRPA
ncbi:MFS transporter [Desulfovibrio sp. 1188_IL3213]|uniref:MFS transporter n=1 Tax=Desulfovibrio sp. 1188_IL3213 TaxID=3084052 RepID=UPI002FD88199